MRKARRAFGYIGGLAATVWLLWGTSRLMLERRVEVLRGTTVQYYVTPETWTQGRLLRSIEVDADGFLVQTSNAIVRLKRRKPAWDSPLDPQLVTEDLQEDDGFTVDAGGVMFATRSDVLYQVGGSGLQFVAKLPRALAAAPSREPRLLYLFGAGDVFLAGDVKGTARRIAAFDDIPEPISALCEGTDGYYVAVGKVILQIFGHRKRRVFELPAAEESTIDSLGCTDRSDLLFFATPHTIYALFGTTAVPVTRDFGGVIRWRDRRLFALDPRRGFLIGISDIEKALGLGARG